MVAIATCHVGTDGSTPSSHPLVVWFLKDMRWLRPVSKPMAPTWDLALVLDAPCEPPFEPLESLDQEVLSYKTALLMALASPKRVGSISTRYQYTLPVCSRHLATPRWCYVLLQIFLLRLCQYTKGFKCLSCSLSHLLRLLPVNNRGCMACVRCALYAGTVYE